MTLFKEVRLKYGYTQQKMADEMSLKLRTYRSYELAQNMPPYEVLRDILIMRNKKEDRVLANILDETLKDGRYEKIN